MCNTVLMFSAYLSGSASVTVNVVESLRFVAAWTAEMVVDPTPSLMAAPVAVPMEATLAFDVLHVTEVVRSVVVSSV